MLRLLLVITTLGSMAVVLACSADSPGAQPTGSPPTATGHGGGTQRGFQTLADLGREYKIAVFAPAGVPISGVDAIEGENGELDNYEYQLFGGAGSAGVRPAAAGAIEDQPEAQRLNTDFDRIRTTLFVNGGTEYLMIQQQNKQYPYLDTFRLLWIADGSLLQVMASTFGARGVFPAPGPDAVLQTARLMRRFDEADFASTDLVTDTRGDVFAFVQTGDAGVVESVLGVTPIDAKASHFTVVKAGDVRGYSADLDAKGLRRLYRIPVMPEAAEPQRANLISSSEVTVRGRRALFEKVKTESATTSLLFFESGPEAFMIRDANGAEASELLAAAESAVGPPP